MLSLMVGITLPKQPKSVFAWTKLISQHAKGGQGREALTLYKQMRDKGVAPNNYTFAVVLKACSAMADLESGKQIHGHAIESGYVKDIFVGNSLVDMYAKCGNMPDARHVFDNMIYKDVVSWTAIIMGYAHMNMGHSALELFRAMKVQCLVPDGRTFVAALKACGSMAAEEENLISCLEQGRAIHAEVSELGLESDMFVANTLIDMYAKCGSMDEAYQVFEKMRHRDIVSWNAMIAGYARTKMADSTLQLYAQMQHEGFMPNARTFVAAINVCGRMGGQEQGKDVDKKFQSTHYLQQGRTIHAQLMKRGFELDMIVTNSLVDMYMKCGSIDDACQVFEKMKHRDVVSWNAMITGYAQMDMGDLALELYACMRNEGFTPNSRTFVAALKACGSLASEGSKGEGRKLFRMCSLQQGKDIHAEVARKGFESNIFVASTLVDMYAKCGSIEDARQVFEKMRHRNLVSWNAMITGYAQMEMGGLALELYSAMQNEGFTPDARTFLAAIKACGSLASQVEEKGSEGEVLKGCYLRQGKMIHTELAKRGLESDIFITSALVDMYAKCGSIEDACRVFKHMSHRDVISWTAMIIGYVQMEMGDLALELYDSMQQEGLTPDACTFAAVLMACGSLASLEIGKEIHSQIVRVGLQDELFIANCLIDMYGKCGSIVNAQHVFDSLHVRDSVTWNALIRGYSGQGDSDHLFNLFNRMQLEGIKPDNVTFISVLNACSHNGLVEKGKAYFQAMYLEYKISPSSSHYACMTDLLSRAGQLDEAVAIVKKMPFESDIPTWITILSGCRKWENVGTGRRVFECVVMLDKKFVAPYILMINIYVSAKMWEESARTEEMGIKARAWRKPEQCMWTDSAGTVHTFPPLGRDV